MIETLQMEFIKFTRWLLSWLRFITAPEEILELIARKENVLNNVNVECHNEVQEYLSYMMKKLNNKKYINKNI